MDTGWPRRSEGVIKTGITNNQASTVKVRIVVWYMNNGTKNEPV